MSNRHYSPEPSAPPFEKLEHTERKLLGYTNDQLRVIDPLEMNLLIAKGIPALSKLNIFPYTQKIVKWATEIKHGLREAEQQFYDTPWHWKNDLAFFRLGYMCYYVDEKLGIAYREDQRDLSSVSYTNASDLFLNGVMDTNRGTCGNMAALHVALGWRLHWPVSLACVGSHYICRYDDGKVTHNIEATKTGGHGFHSHPDEYYLCEHRLPRKAVTCGSDLRALTPMEMLGIFFGLRARHFQDTNNPDFAERDWLIARALFPRNRDLQLAQIMVSVQNGMDLFEPNEAGHPVELAAWLGELVRMETWKRQPGPNGNEESSNAENSRVLPAYTWAGRQN